MQRILSRIISISVYLCAYVEVSVRCCECVYDHMPEGQPCVCVSEAGRWFNNCRLRSGMDLSGMCGLSRNHKQLIAAHCVSGFNLPPLLISSHWLLSHHPILCVCVCLLDVCLRICSVYLCVFGCKGWLCGPINDSRGVKEFHRVCVRVWEDSRFCVCVSMDQVLKGAALLVSPGANVIANDKASRRVC